MLDLPYPGGPEIEKLALMGDSEKYQFSIPRVKDNPLALSFSGLKTQVLYTLQKVCKESEKAHIAASFQATAAKVLIDRIKKILKITPFKTLILGGGVSQNKTIRKMLSENLPSDLQILFPDPPLCIDNGAMIAGLGTIRYKQKLSCDLFDLIPTPTGAEKVLFS